MLVESKRIILRSWKNEDLDDLVEGLNNINVSKWLASVPYPYTKKDGEDFIELSKKLELEENPKDMMLAIVLK